MTLGIAIRGTGARETARKLHRFAGEIDTVVGEALARETAAAIQERAAQYEASPVPSYTRTGALAASWFSQPTGAGGYLVGSRSPYAQYVRGSMHRGPAYMHAGRWAAFKDIVTELADPSALRELAIERLARLKRRLFG